MQKLNANIVAVSLLGAGTFLVGTFADRIPEDIQTILAWVGISLVAGSGLAWVIAQFFFSSKAAPEDLAASESDRMKPTRVSFVEFMKIIEAHNWDLFGKDSLALIDIGKGLTQAGVDGDITFYGRKIGASHEVSLSKPLVQIPREIWEDADIDIFSSLKVTTTGNQHFYEIARDNSQTRTHSILSKNEVQKYSDVHVDKGQGEKWLKEKADAYRGRQDAIDKARMDRIEERMPRAINLSVAIAKACEKHFDPNDPYNSRAIDFDAGFYGRYSDKVGPEVARYLVRRIECTGVNIATNMRTKVDWRELNFTHNHAFSDGGDVINEKLVNDGLKPLIKDITITLDEFAKCLEILRTESELIDEDGNTYS